jgi:mRNA-degrading endonuclease toxin of MazEF toxin-antitoxin module
LKKYIELDKLNEKGLKVVVSKINKYLTRFTQNDFTKLISLITYLPESCRLTYNSLYNQRERSEHKKKHHPVTPFRGGVYNALLGENIGSELSGNHLVIIVQNKKGNLYADKVNVLPIEGDGSKINPAYQIKLSNDDMETGKLDKDPSRIIVSDILTIDKARLDLLVGKVNSNKMIEVNNLLYKQLSLDNNEEDNQKQMIRIPKNRKI